MTAGPRSVHDFCWINVLTRNHRGAKAFFGRLFGWTFGEMPGVPQGELIRVADRTAGALMDLDAPGTPPAPPSAYVMIRVDNAQRTVDRVVALGGRAEPPVDVLQNGRMAICIDPNGAQFGVWEPKNEVGMDVDSHVHGAPTWFETLTTDAARARRFYTELFGWRAEDRSMPGMTYTILSNGSEPTAGLMSLPPHMKGVPAHWAVNIAVRDADETARLATELGGTLCLPVMEIPDVGRFAQVQSPQGVSLYVLQRQH